jgi:hypothetical protein
MTGFFCILRHVAAQNLDRLEESRVSTLMGTECIEVHNIVMEEEICRLDQTVCDYLFNRRYGRRERERECHAPAGLSSGNRSGVLYTSVWVRLGTGMH